MAIKGGHVTITPPRADKFETLSLYHDTRGGEEALARKRRDDAIRNSGHANSEKPSIVSIG